MFYLASDHILIAEFYFGNFQICVLMYFYYICLRKLRIIYRIHQRHVKYYIWISYIILLLLIAVNIVLYNLCIVQRLSKFINLS